ncbi:flagellar assembly protein FliH [Lysinibacillus yapensis]|uniref:Flagellar assembly protein FliH n=1 Tax=Ureibacillus yapensis TaxID=2304605 RepID=A0A396SKU9_9BACL|nr:flagellar assembly protein FliH [Lysinibacillus yapensis]
MSRIIRSAQFQQEDKQVEIQLRNLFTEDFNGEDIEKHQPNASLIQIQEERERLLSDAKLEVEAQQQQFEAYRNAQLEELEQLKKAWEEEKLLLEQNAYEQGFQQGYEEGMTKAHADMQESLALANRVIEDSKVMANQYREEQEYVILELAIAAAERIINTTLEKEDEVFLSIVKKGLKEAREMKEIKIYVSPVYHALLTQHRSELVEIFPTDVPLFIFVDDELMDTQCYIETNHGRIVLSVDQQLSELRLKLNEILDTRE